MRWLGPAPASLKADDEQRLPRQNASLSST